MGTEFFPEAAWRSNRTLLATWAVNVPVFLLTFAAGLAAIAWLPPQYPPEVEARLQYLREHQGEFDTLFIGSSSLACHLDPDAFDAEMKVRGHDTQSVNLAMMGMLMYEADVMLRAVLDTYSGDIKQVFINADWPPLWIDPLDHLQARTVWWHTARGTANIVDAILRSPETTSDKARLLWAHGQHMAMHYLRAGEGGEIARVLLYGIESNTTWQENWKIMEEHKGFSPMKSTANIADRVAGRAFGGRGPGSDVFMKNTVQLRRSLRVAPLPADLRKYPLSILRAQCALVESRGALPIYVVPPDPFRLSEWDDIAAAGIVPSLIRMNDPVRFRELFDLRYRHSKRHVDDAGAVFYTRYFAGEAAAALEHSEAGHALH